MDAKTARWTASGAGAKPGGSYPAGVWSRYVSLMNMCWAGTGAMVWHSCTSDRMRVTTPALTVWSVALAAGWARAPVDAVRPAAPARPTRLMPDRDASSAYVNLQV